MKNIKGWLIAAAALVLIGAALFVGAMTACDWNFTQLNHSPFETNTYTIREEFGFIRLDTDTADIAFVPSKDGACRVVCYERESERHDVRAENGVLNVCKADEKKWFTYIGIQVGTPKITVYLPESEYGALVVTESTGDIEMPSAFSFGCIDITASTGDIYCAASASDMVKIETDTGNIAVENITSAIVKLTASTGCVTAEHVNCTGNMEVHVSTGKTYFKDVRCENLLSDGSTGDISLTDVTAIKTFLLERSTGDVMFDGCDAAEITVQTDTGDVTGSLLSDKVFITETDTGHVNVPKTAVGGTCAVTTDTGDIHLSVK